MHNNNDAIIEALKRLLGSNCTASIPHYNSQYVNFMKKNLCLLTEFLTT